MCIGVLFRALCSCCPTACECPTDENSTLCRHRLLSLVPHNIPFSSHLVDLSYNHIRSVPSTAFHHLDYLQELDLSYNQLSRIEPEVFSRLTKLRVLLLNHNHLKLLPPGVFLGMPVLSRLDIRGNQLVIILDQTFQGLRVLKQLEAGENPLLFISPGAFLGMRQLQRLELQETKLGNVPSRALSSLPQLSELKLGGISSTVLRDLSFPGIPWLRVLDMNRWTSLESLESHSLSGLNLSSLSITYSNLSSIPVEALRVQIYLQRLDLSHNPVSEIPVRGFSTMRVLEELRLCGGRLRSVHSQAFYGLSRLRLLDLSDNPLSWLAEDSLPTPLGILETLFLSGTMLSCDCRLCWLLHRRIHFGGKPPLCEAPSSLKGMVIPEKPQAICPDLFNCQPPRIDSSGIHELIVQEGDILTIICHSLGVPMPSIQWVLPQTPKSEGNKTIKMGPVCPTTKLPQTTTEHPTATVSTATGSQVLETPENSQLPDVKRVIILPDDSLHFRPVQVEDTGAYLCVANNVAGNDTAWVHLKVIPFNNSKVTPSTNNSRLLVVITAGGLLPFISSVTLCFIFMLLWSKGRGNIKHTAVIEYVPRGTRGEPETEDNKFTMKLL
ncbi:hypothetical protein GDO86_017937 [Hymenochirus boettgeri]|uniref:Ig-like domain-containing protein n=1 Tax=Hymenochirus boettgeri TaxID=247094 RepID=A0A8T2IH08_9PIPI|nr:hypothetical protein GDO86_017937 [Hymenochirus boettgeri]